jgi:NAD(P)-dependent dehydrogenase (short-subunit alcohol dehydrogenase family)
METKGIRDKVALVTGGSSGIGRATALLLARNGAQVAVVASSDIGKAQAVVEEISSQGGEARAFQADVRAVQNIDTLVREVHTCWGGIDILVNSAGVYYPTLIGETSEEAYDRMADINLKGMFFTMDRVATGMKARQRGKICNVASIAAFVGSGNYGLYCALKAGVVALTKTFALQLAPYGINVNAIAPGNTRSPINEDVRTKPEFAGRRAMIDAQTPSPRKFSDPEDIAAGILFLVSEESRAMNGATLLMDEGRAAGM